MANRKHRPTTWESLFVDDGQGRFSVREGEVEGDENNPGQQLVQAELFTELYVAILKLPRRERDILYRRWGLRGPRECHRRIGMRHGISKQRVNQLEQAALTSLRKHMRNRTD